MENEPEKVEENPEEDNEEIIEVENEPEVIEIENNSEKITKEEEKSWLQEILASLAKSQSTLAMNMSSMTEEMKRLKRKQSSTPQLSSDQITLKTTSPETKTETSLQTKTEAPEKSEEEKRAVPTAEKLRREIRRL